MDSKNIPSVYNPREVEDKWYAYWEEKKYFHAEVDPSANPFSIVIPPPNVTGMLHLGHALDETLQDILIRWRRMQGYNTVWVPGTDHAGIATQIKVEEQIAKEGLSKYDLGREKFLDRVWDWKHKYGNTIIDQLKKLGASCDWERERFTMDEGCSEAVKEVFIRLYNEGLIYQGNYIVNWCPRCNTVLSDIEVEHADTEGNLYYLKYPVENSSDYVIVATTRPETMLGDTGVAVNPEDERYLHLVGKYLILPEVGRKIPVITDQFVDPSFGTGAVKVTPSHDPNDFEMGKRHDLPFIQVINQDGSMSKEAGKYAGMDRYECRKALIKDFEQAGILEKIVPHRHAVGHCYRCDNVIEPLVLKQWFVKMKPLAEPAIQAVKEGKIKFVPERFTKTYLNWVENIRDWCISRQLWWGHRIPIWYCKDCNEVIASKDTPDKCPKCGSLALEQDPDVLDTWFSSGLWPFSTMGWPKDTAELKHFYPTSVLVTGYDIIFFWVARMIFMGLKFMDDVPFHKVYIHGLLRDAQGRKMSKSLGNGVDPLEVISQFGADTLRFSLVTGNTPGNDIRFSPEKIEASRNFANKIWNASRFVLMNLTDFDPAEIDTAKLALTFADEWILSRYNQVVKDVTNFLEKFDLGEARRTLYDFIWSEYCDWYIEITKPRLYQKEDVAARRTVQYVLSYVLRNTMQILHPFMPFITEEIWQCLPHVGETVMLAPWPEFSPVLDCPKSEKKMQLIMEIVREIRNIRSEVNVAPGKKVGAIIVCNDKDIEKNILDGQGYIKNLAGIGELQVTIDQGQKPEKAMTAVVGGAEIHLPLKDLVDFEKEKERINKELSTVEAEIKRLSGKLNNPGFLAKAPADVVEKEKEKFAGYEDKKNKLQERLREIM